MSDKKQRMFYLHNNNVNVLETINNYLKEDWYVKEIQHTDSSYLIVLEKDLTLK